MNPEDLMCTDSSDGISTERKLVVVFDICSSTTILEELKQTDCLGQWRNFLISLKECIESEGEMLGVHLYKFQGDGWILLFPRKYGWLNLAIFSIRFRRTSTRILILSCFRCFKGSRARSASHLGLIPA